MVMVSMGSREVYDRLKQINPDVKVLLTSGCNADNKIREMLERGCNGFIPKPFMMLDLAEKLREIVDGLSSEIPHK